jgi:hypothetical protein
MQAKGRAGGCLKKDVSVGSDFFSQTACQFLCLTDRFPARIFDIRVSTFPAYVGLNRLHMIELLDQIVGEFCFGLLVNINSCHLLLLSVQAQMLSTEKQKYHAKMTAKMPA